MIWELLPFVAIGNDGKQRIVDVAEPVRPPGPGSSRLSGAGSGLGRIGDYLPKFPDAKPPLF